MPNSDTDRFGNQLKYSLDDPTTALNNAMLDTGLNPYSANPFMEMYKRAAPGLAFSYAGDMAAGGLYGNPTETRGAPDFGSYLRNAISGGGVMDRLRAYSGGGGMGQGYGGGLFNAVSNARRYNSARASGLQANFNPYVAYIADAMAANNGRGLTDLMLSATAPTLGSTDLARSYRSGLDASYGGALRNIAGAGDTRNDIWRYILGF